jgi:hypothetical protein
VAQAALPNVAAGHAGVLRHPAFGGLARFARWPRPDDDELATAQTVGLMARYIRQDARHPLLRRVALQAAAAAKKPKEAAAAIFHWIRRRVRLVEDRALAQAGGFPEPEDAEVLIRPLDLLRMPQPQGDCDDQVMLAAAMLGALGIPSVLVTIAADPAQPGRYSHVYLVALTPQGPLSLDPSHGPYPGWHPPALGKTKIWRLSMPTLGFALPDSATTATNFWQDLARTGAETFADIARARWGQPPAGTYVQTGPGGSVYYRQQPGTFQFPTAQIGSGWGGWVTAAVLVVVVLLLVKAVTR